jgi:uncharacterized SAM-binding protein YcdF (DUF218 family)
MIKILKYNQNKSAYYSTICKVLIGLILTAFIVVLVTAAAIVFDGLNDEVQKSDMIVILGNRVEPDGNPSARLKSRLDKGIELYQQNTSPLILVSGGIGIEGFDESIVMKDYLIKHGIPNENIIPDGKGIDSFNTARNSKIIMDQKNISTVLVVSNYYHISRTRLALNKFGAKKVYSAHANYFELRDIYSIAREVVGYYYYYFIK